MLPYSLTPRSLELSIRDAGGREMIVGNRASLYELCVMDCPYFPERL